MDLRKLKTLIDLVSESNVAELEITEPEGKVRIVKSQGDTVYPSAWRCCADISRVLPPLI
jgi:acetyl-CoA carboxylase biotin carboxyl carrier protein